MAITSDFTNIATTTRASKAWDPGAWDFVSGSAVGALVEYAANAPRITSSGLLVEETSTNQITNPRAEGATTGIIGSGGALPTAWEQVLASGVDWDIKGTGTEDGWPYIDIQFVGTPTGDVYLGFQTSTSISAATGDDWALSCGFKIVAGDMTNLNLVYWHFVERASGSFVAQSSNSTFTPDSTHRRYHMTATLAGGGTVNQVQPRFVLDYDNSGDIDITLRFYCPQMEGGAGSNAKAYPTSPVLPDVSSPAASTRNADDITVAIGSWYSATCSLFMAWTPASLSASQRFIMELSDDSSSDRFYVRQNPSTSTIRTLYTAASTNYIADDSATPCVAGTERSIAIAIAENDAAVSHSGGEAQYTDSSVSLISNMATFNIGASFGEGSHFDGYISDLRFWPRRLTNAELEALVGN